MRFLRFVHILYNSAGDLWSHIALHTLKLLVVAVAYQAWAAAFGQFEEKKKTVALASAVII